MCHGSWDFGRDSPEGLGTWKAALSACWEVRGQARNSYLRGRQVQLPPMTPLHRDCAKEEAPSCS